MIEPETTVDCVHWWRIREPNGPVSKARCKLCGAKREFENGYYLQGKVERQP